MTAASRLGDTTVLHVTRAEEVAPALRDQLEVGSRLLCVDASELVSDDAEDFAEAVCGCARIVGWRGGHLTVVCSLATVRRRLWAAGLPVFSDRTIAESVLA